MNDSDNKNTFSNTPNEDWTENDNTNSLFETSKEEESELVEESSTPLEKEEDVIDVQEEMEETMEIDNTIEEIKEDILEEDLTYKMSEAEMLEANIVSDIEKEIEIDNELEEEISIEDSKQEEDVIHQEASFVEKEGEIVTELNEETELHTFEFQQESLNGTQNDEAILATENIQINEANLTTEEPIDLTRGFRNVEELENRDESFFVETSTLINQNNNEEDMLKKPNFLFAILGGLGAILLSSLFWAETALLLDKYYNYDHKYAYMALFVALCVGLGIRWAGKGTTYGYAILAMILTLCGSLSGTLLSTLVHVVEAFGVSYFDIFDIFDFTFLYGLLQDRFQNLDIAFYISAVILAYWISIRKKNK